ncbi:MAG TPA: rRNA adenine N-6-methyltransferase family protein [Acidimicrobiales bacterium]|nr:rRNA adenine N-6-methyltransferase family protein [Acidimicrobiales bacterium]
MRAAQRRWGYHRLSDAWAQRVVAAADVSADDLVLDLGAGAGALTRPLARTGARVIAIELHAGRARALRGAVQGDVKVVEEDAAAIALPRRPFRVVANPPFAVCTSIIRTLTRRDSQLVRADLVLPWYVTKRWLYEGSRDWDFGAGVRLPSRAFDPAATCEARVLRITRRTSAEKFARST